MLCESWSEPGTSTCSVSLVEHDTVPATSKNFCKKILVKIRVLVLVLLQVVVLV